MKKLLFSTTAIAALLVISSCGKYEEGPGFTVLTKKMRLAGKWDLKESTNGSITIADSATDLIEFTKDNTYIYSLAGVSVTGTWAFTDDKMGVVESFTFFGQTTSDTINIIRLTNKELWSKSGSTISKYEKK